MTCSASVSSVFIWTFIWTFVLINSKKKPYASFLVIFSRSVTYILFNSPRIRQFTSWRIICFALGHVCHWAHSFILFGANSLILCPHPNIHPEMVQRPNYLCPVHAPPHSSPNALKAPAKACKYCISANKKQTLGRRFAASDKVCFVGIFMCFC